MSPNQRWRKRLGESYWAWRLYHLFVADAVSIQRPTKYRIVYEFLSDNLGRVADVGCGPGVFTRYLCERAREVCAVDIDEAVLRRVKARLTTRTTSTASYRLQIGCPSLAVLGTRSHSWRCWNTCQTISKEFAKCIGSSCRRKIGFISAGTAWRSKRRRSVGP